jgi:uncharacterized protein (DUF58 family)
MGVLKIQISHYSIRPKIIWAVFLIGAAVGAWILGERILYISAIVLFALPILSYAITFLLLRGLKVSHAQPESVAKNTTGILSVRLHNRTFLPLGINVLIYADENAISVLENQTAQINPFSKRILEIPFEAAFRGHYEFGLKAVLVSDITGLFKLKRSFGAAKTITALPLVAENRNFPLAMMTQTGSSRHDIRDEDYSTIADIRQYLPTDSIKRVHWKLTAKRSEWLVKNFQSNALNLVSIILDSTRLSLHPKKMYALEDRMTEHALGLAKFCLNRSMPVDFLTTDGQKSNAKNPAQFDLHYKHASELRFSQNAAMECSSVLSRELNETTGYLNAIILTANVNAKLYDRITNGTNNGHYISLLYFPTPESESHENSEEIFKLLIENAIPCFQIV